MAGSDPKTNRALGQTSNRGDVDADEDPLVELARIVSEDGGGFSSPKAQTPKVVRGEPSPRDTLADGLEAELLQELETSFSARETSPKTNSRAPAAARGNSAPPAAVRPALAPLPPPPIQGEPDPDELLRSIEEQLSQFERRQAGRFGSSSVVTPEADEPEAAEQVSAAEEPEELPFGAPDREADLEEEWQGRRASRIRPFAESLEPLDEVAENVAEPEFDEPPPREVPRPEYRFRGPANAEWDRTAAAHPEYEPRTNDAPSDAAAFTHAESAPAAKPVPREHTEANLGLRGLGDAEQSVDAPRGQRIKATFPEFDEPAKSEPDLTGIEAEMSRELEPRFADTDDDKWQDGDGLADEPRGAAAIAPGPSRRAAAARAAAANRSRSRIGMLAAAVILVVVIGGAAAFYLRSSETTPSGPPPVIAAESGDVRVEPSPQQASTDSETVGEAVYNRVAGNAPPTEEQVVENAEEPREIARIVLPPSQSTSDQNVVRQVGQEEGSAPSETVGAEPPAASAAPAPAPAPPAASAGEEIGPRLVPTFVVRADGSIVTTSEAGSAPADPTAAQDQQLTSETEPIEPTPVPTVAIAEAGTSASGEDAGSPPVPTPPAEDAAGDLGTRSTIDEPPAEVAVVAPEPEPEPAPPAEASPDVAAAPPQVAPPVPAGSGGFLVQLSSEGSMADAQSAFARARQRFPSLLDNLDPQIQQADLGAKGIFYRVRVGPWPTRKEAVDLCEALKAAGGNCFVAQ